MGVKKQFVRRELGRRVRSTNCPRCRTGVLAGYDADVCGLLWMVDLWPLSPLGEATALLAGRKTFRLLPRAERYELEPRYAGQIRELPAAVIDLGTFVDVRVEHRCHRPITAIAIPPPDPRPDPNAPPPF